MKESIEEKRARLLGLAKASLSEAYSTEEHSLIQAINAYNETEKTRNLMHERLEEWYSIYFPEAKISSPSVYAKFIIEFGRNKKEVEEIKLEEIFGDKKEEMKSIIERSIGREPTNEEYAAVRRIAEEELSLIELEKRLDNYIEKTTKKLIPNISYLIDYKIAAELLAKSGSLSKLAVMPASTIQLLGAEKALFKHIKFGSRPPKYGYLFKIAPVTNASRDDRGRVARLYAAKISIAARADAFTKNFIAPRLKEDIDKALSRERKHGKKREYRASPSQSHGRDRGRERRFRNRGSR